MDNPQGELLPGGYVSVHLKLPGRVQSVTIPANTLLFRREGLRAGIVRNGHAELVPIVIGRDYGATVEVVSGLRTSDLVIVDPPDSLLSGVPVRRELPLVWAREAGQQNETGLFFGCLLLGRCSPVVRWDPNMPGPTFR